jgi:valine--pyruvate aminotransferase
VVPGNYFFFGLGQQWKHQDECIRINYSQDEKEVQAAVEIMADELAKL